MTNALGVLISTLKEQHKQTNHTKSFIANMDYANCTDTNPLFGKKQQELYYSGLLYPFRNHEYKFDKKKKVTAIEHVLQ